MVVFYDVYFKVEVEWFKENEVLFLKIVDIIVEKIFFRILEVKKGDKGRYKIVF